MYVWSTIYLYVHSGAYVQNNQQLAPPICPSFCCFVWNLLHCIKEFLSWIHDKEVNQKALFQKLIVSEGGRLIMQIVQIKLPRSVKMSVITQQTVFLHFCSRNTTRCTMFWLVTYKMQWPMLCPLSKCLLLLFYIELGTFYQCC